MHGGTVEAAQRRARPRQRVRRPAAPAGRAPPPRPAAVAPPAGRATPACRACPRGRRQPRRGREPGPAAAAGRPRRRTSPTTARGAWRSAREFRPDVVLLDIGLPRHGRLRGGAAAARPARIGGVLLVALTGYGQDDDRRRSRQAGFDHHLVKPVDPVVLEEVLAGLTP